MSFSRDETVNVVTSYYEFLTTHLPHLEPHHLCRPPSTGWLEINSNSLSRLNKSAGVIDLLRHLPYISQQAGNSSFAQNVRVIDLPYWVEQQTKTYEKIQLWGHPMLEAALPSHAIVLTMGDDWTSHYVLDTQRGTITDWSMHRRLGHQETNQSPSHTMSKSEQWMHHPTKPIAGFFDDLRQKFLNLEWVPRIGGNSEGIEERWPGVQHAHLDHLADIYRAFGWPDLDRFDRDGCKAMITEIEERIKDGYLRKSRWGDLSRRGGVDPEVEEKFTWVANRVLEIRNERYKAQHEADMLTEKNEVMTGVSCMSSDEQKSENEDGHDDEQTEDDPGWMELCEKDQFVEVETDAKDRAETEKELQIARHSPTDENDRFWSRQEIEWELVASPTAKL